MKWILLFIVTLILFSCRVQRQPQPGNFEIVSITPGGDQFTARSGRTVVVFNKLPGDSIWIGKKITAGVGRKIKGNYISIHP